MAEGEEKKKTVVGPYLDLGMQLAIAVLIGTVLGYWIDKKLHTTPLFLIVLVIAGGVAGFMNIYRTVYPGSGGKRSAKGQ